MSHIWVIEMKIAGNDDNYYPLGLGSSPAHNFFRTRKEARHAHSLFCKLHRYLPSTDTRINYRIRKYVVVD